MLGRPALRPPRPWGNCESYVVFHPSPPSDGECVSSPPVDCTVVAPAAAVECRLSRQCRRHPNPRDACLSGQRFLPYSSYLHLNIKIKYKRSFFAHILVYIRQKRLDTCYNSSKITLKK